MNNIKVYLICLLVVLIGCSKQQSKLFYPPEKSPEIIGKKITDEYLSRVDFMLYITDDCRSIHYAEVCAAFGAARLAGLLKDTVTINQIFDRYRNVEEEGPENTKNHVDANVYGVLPLELFIQTGDKKYFNEGIQLADMQWEYPLPNGMTNQTRYWIDDIYMIGALQVQAYRATGKMVYLERAALEIDNYLNELQQRNGLFYHGRDIPFFWGRGNGWVAAGLAEIISVLPEENPHYNSIVKGYKDMMNALLMHQTYDGMWRQLIDKKEAWKETSCTAMFGYAISEGVKRGILDREIFTPVYQKAWLALCDYLNEEGKLTDVCVGTGQVNDINYYLERPTVAGDFHGQAPMLWFAWSILTQENIK